MLFRSISLGLVARQFDNMHEQHSLSLARRIYNYQNYFNPISCFSFLIKTCTAASTNRKYLKKKNWELKNSGGTNFLCSAHWITTCRLQQKIFLQSLSSNWNLEYFDLEIYKYLKLIQHINCFFLDLWCSQGKLSKTVTITVECSDWLPIC